MSLQDQVASDCIAVRAAQAALDEANAKLAKDQDALAAVQPHLSALDEIAAYAESLDISLREAFSELIAKARGLF